MEECCRICLGQTSPISSFHVSLQISFNKSISQLVYEFSSIEITEQDSFPKYVCSKCYQQLLDVHGFRNLIIESDAHLKQKPTRRTSHSSSPQVTDMKGENEFADNHLESVIKTEESGSDEDVQSNGNLIKTEAPESALNVCGRVKPGRKPSKTAINRRKVHEFTCEICKKVLFGRSNRLQQHIIMAHSDIKNFVCEMCNKKFKTKQQLINHTRVHTGEKPYQCDICKGMFASPQNLFNHKKKHTDEYKNNKCDLCEKGYSTPGELETHTRIAHTGEKPFLCEICSRAFSSMRNLGLHIRSVHEKTEKCPKCGLMLSNKRIKQHVQNHQDKEDGIRRYTCDKCGKGFFTRQALKKHQVVHTGERPYSCQICNKSFSQKSTVDTHMKSHSDVRSFSCELCAKTFKYKQHLQLHLIKKHKLDVCKDSLKVKSETI